MKRLSLLSSSALALLMSTISLSAAEWKDLFDGKTLDGWTRLGGEAHGKAHYTVQNGAIVGTTVSNTPNSFLATNEMYGDFILEFEVKQIGKTNSGVQFRSNVDPDYRNGRLHGYQCEIDPSDRAWTAGIFDEARRGWLARPQHNPWVRAAYQYGHWNHFRIEAIGNTIQTFVNGIQISHLVDDMDAKGMIGLQVHSIRKGVEPGAQIKWRNIRILTGDIELSEPDPRVFVRNHIPNNLSKGEKKQGWKLLFDGKTTDQWRGVHKDYFPDFGWSVEENGELMIAASGGGESTNAGDIVTKKEYSAFELQLEFYMTPGANSGIKYFVTEGYLTEGEKRSAIGLEYQILDDELHKDAKLGAAGNRTAASLYDMIPSKPVVIGRTVPRKAEQWHHARLIVYPDNKVEHWLNGYKVVEYERGSPAYWAIVERSKYVDWEGFGVAKSGHILLQDHGDEVRFRSIKIREL